MPLDESIVGAVANSNFKTMAEMATQNAISNQHAMNLIGQSSVGQIVNRMNALDPMEAASISGVVSSDLSEKLGEMSAAIANAQQLMKGAQTTQPETGA